MSQNKPKQTHNFPVKRVVFFGTVFICIVSSLLLHVWYRLRVIEMGYEIAQVLGEQRELNQINRRLKIEISRLTSVDRVKAYAAKNQLRVPRADEVILISQ
jgi:cell division protein FtsL